MQRLLTVLFVIVFSFTFVKPVQAEVDPRLKAVGLMAVYGTVGGALLGTASLAFGSGGRSVAKGASLGLYAGLLFGSYVVLSHVAKKKGWSFSSDNFYEDPAPTPYTPEEDTGTPYEEEYTPVGAEEEMPMDQGYRWDNRFDMPDSTSTIGLGHKPKNAFELYVPVFITTF